MDRAAYRHLVLSLLPRGDAWPREAGTALSDLAGIIAGEFARLDTRVDDLLNEANPARTLEMLADWEAAYGLPDACAGNNQTLDGRRERLLQKRAMKGGQSKPYFISLAAALGYAVDITTFAVATCQSACTTPLYGEPWRFVFRVDAPAVTIREATCESGCDEPLRIWGNQILECAVRRHTHSHNHALFSYGA